MAPILYVRLQSDRKERERRFIEHELKEINEHLDNIIESSLDCIMVTDSTGKISRTNKSFQKLLGREEEEIVGKHMSYFLPPDKKIYESTSGKPIDINEDFLIEVKAKIATFLKEGTLYNWETYFTRHDKKLIPIEANLSILRDDKQTVVGGVVILRDISDRRHEEEMLERVNQCLLSFSPDSDENIKNILETAGLVLGSICTLYNREDGPFLCTVEGWNIPKDLKRKDRKEGHICYDIMTKFKRDKPYIINDHRMLPQIQMLQSTN
jgi:transcriptional regulator with PAS, ATPase and Fis domain